MMDFSDMTAREAEGLIDFLNASPCNFWAVDTIRRILADNGYTELDMADSWAENLSLNAATLSSKTVRQSSRSESATALRQAASA